MTCLQTARKEVPCCWMRCEEESTEGGEKVRGKHEGNKRRLDIFSSGSRVACFPHSGTKDEVEDVYMEQPISLPSESRGQRTVNLS